MLMYMCCCLCLLPAGAWKDRSEEVGGTAAAGGNRRRGARSTAAAHPASPSNPTSTAATQAPITMPAIAPPDSPIRVWLRCWLFEVSKLLFKPPSCSNDDAATCKPAKHWCKEIGGHAQPQMQGCCAPLLALALAQICLIAQRTLNQSSQALHLPRQPQIGPRSWGVC